MVQLNMCALMRSIPESASSLHDRHMSAYGHNLWIWEIHQRDRILPKDVMETRKVIGYSAVN